MKHENKEIFGSNIILYNQNQNCSYTKRNNPVRPPMTSEIVASPRSPLRSFQGPGFVSVVTFF